jgi:sialidase-1
LSIVRQWEDGVGKIGNATPVFDSETGTLFLFHIAGAKPPYTTWVMQSTDGGLTFSEAVELGEGIVGPGHGIRTTTGRLVIPAHVSGSSFAWISDDHGQTWLQGEPVGVGNESEIAETGDGSLVMTIRTNHAVSKPHDPLYQLFSFSQDDGQTWLPAQDNGDIRTSICMTSIVQSGGRIFFSYPDDFYSRARMTIAISSDGGQTFPKKRLIYAGPSGYSDLGALSNGDLLLLFENGAVEYDEHLMLVRVSGK